MLALLTGHTVVETIATDNFAVFVSAPAGANIEPSYETGASIAEAVRKTIDVIKGGTNKNGTKTDNQSEVAPF